MGRRAREADEVLKHGGFDAIAVYLDRGSQPDRHRALLHDRYPDVLIMVMPCLLGGARSTLKAGGYVPSFVTKCLAAAGLFAAISDQALKAKPFARGLYFDFVDLKST
jgi:hypothetical protein